MDKQQRLSAEEYRAAAMAHQQKARATWSIFWKVGPIAIAAVIALMTTGIAWFVNNNRVTSRDMGIGVSSAPYYIGCLEPENAMFTLSDLFPGNPLTAKTVYSSECTNGTFSKKSELPTLRDHDITTTIGNQQIQWFMDGTNSNFLSQKGTIRSLEPGKGGALTFYLLLQEKTDQEAVTFHLELHGYQQTLLNSDKQVVFTDTRFPAKQIQEITSGSRLELLQHHILFFTDAQHQNWIRPGDTFSVDISELTPGEAMEITLYWQWPAHFSDFQSNALKEEAQKHPTFFFCQENGEFDGITADVLNDSVQSVVFYDAADSAIGRTFQFAEVRLYCGN